jgi:small-conductance mechanosensitive channel
VHSVLSLVLAVQASLVKWGIVAGLIVLAIFLPPLLGKIVRRTLAKPSRSEKEKTLAEPAARFTTTIALVVLLLAVLGVASPASLAPFPTQIVAFIPRLLITVLLLLIGSTVATFVANGVGVAMTKSMGSPQPAIVRLVRAVVVIFVSILAVSQLGIDTTIVDTLTSAAIYASIGSIALLSVLGGRGIASELAAGRYMRRIVAPGDHVECALGSGTVTAIHGATLELDAGDGKALHIPHAAVMSSAITVKKA